MLPGDFQFSQASLQDYVDCRRRFQLRYLLALAWPAVEAEPVAEYEAHLLQGELFHRLVHQHQLGIPADRLAGLVQGGSLPEGDATLTVWWENYLRSGPEGLPPKRYPEITLSAPVGGHRLLAKYDLVAVEPGRRAVIVDWKTSRVRPGRPWLVARLQTRVYRYLLVRAGAQLTGPISADQVEMTYWFASYPDQPERLRYSEMEYQADHEYLAALIGEIAHAGPEEFPLTDDAGRCRFCVYRSLCARGQGAGPWAEADLEAEAPSAWEAGFDFEQVAELEL